MCIFFISSGRKWKFQIFSAHLLSPGTEKSVLKKYDQEISSLQCRRPARVAVLTLTSKGLDAQASPQTIRTAENRTQATVLPQTPQMIPTCTKVENRWSRGLVFVQATPPPEHSPVCPPPLPPHVPLSSLLTSVQTSLFQGGLFEFSHSVMLTSDTVS